jgi:DNA helicase-2/ATP-dependent DNA helicase PcrA
MSESWSQLNEEQQKAVFHDQGPLLIVAGAGTGKTTVLINRLLYLIMEKKIDPQNILIITFTEKATRELEERADCALPYGYVELPIFTFHGLGDRILRQHGLDIGLNPDYETVNQTEQWILIKKNLDRFDLDYYRPLGDPDKFIAELVKHFSHLKDENISSQQYLDYALELEQNQDNMLNAGKLEKTEVQRIKELANAFHTYNQILLENGCLDFGDLINYTLKLLAERPHILKYYQQQFQYIMVDEFQDTNWAQYELIKLLALPNNNLTVVGDDDQSIYRFRGSSLANIIQFKEDYPTANVIVLTQNYRSSQIILDHAYQFIQQNNPNRLEQKLGINKNIKAGKDLPGQVQHFSYPTILNETQAVAQAILELQQQGKADWSDMAILIRANNTADRFIAEFKRLGIPHQFMSLRGLYYKKVITDLLAYLRWLRNCHESAALLRVLEMPAVSLPHIDIINLNRYARTKLISVYEAMTQAAMIKDLPATSKTKIENLLKMLAKHQTSIKEHRLAKIYIEIVKDMILPYINQDIDAQDFSFLNQFYRKILTFEQRNPDGQLGEFLQLLDWELESGDTGSLQINFEDADTVKIITVHSAKGLEFKYVWLVDLVHLRFPSTSRTDRIPVADELIKEKIVDSKDAHLEEERRLFYVAMTRAKEGLFMTSARDHGGAALKKPSRFVEEAKFQTKTTADQEAVTELQRDLDNPLPNIMPAVSYPLPKKFSFSQLQVFKLCPWRYRYEHILQAPMPAKSTTTFGRIMHSTLQKFLEPTLPGQPRQTGLFTAGQNDNNDSDNESQINNNLTWQHLQNIFKQEWHDYGFESRQDADEYQQQGHQQLKAWYDGFTKTNVLFLEQRFNWKLQDYTIVGTIDRVDELPDGSLEIIDYKTGKPKDKLDTDDKRQLLVYQSALETLQRKPISKLTYCYLQDGSTQSFTAKQKDLEQIKEFILDTIHDIEKFDFSPNPGHICRYCDWKQICEFGQG